MKWIMRAKNMCNIVIFLMFGVGIFVVFMPTAERIEAYREVLQALAYIVVPWMAAIFGGRFMDGKGIAYESNQSDRGQSLPIDPEQSGTTRQRVRLGV